jgi:hypothetical protein
MENKPKFHPNPKLKLMEQVCEVLRYHHYAYRTEQTYSQWILRFIHFFGGKTHPRNLGPKGCGAFSFRFGSREGSLSFHATASPERHCLSLPGCACTTP